MNRKIYFLSWRENRFYRLSLKNGVFKTEPTAAVDQYHKNFVLEMVRELTKNATCIIVSHDPSIYNSGLFPKKFVIQDGYLKNPIIV